MAKGGKLQEGEYIRNWWWIKILLVLSPDWKCLQLLPSCWREGEGDPAFRHIGEGRERFVSFLYLFCLNCLELKMILMSKCDTLGWQNFISFGLMWDNEYESLGMWPEKISCSFSYPLMPLLSVVRHLWDEWLDLEQSKWAWSRVRWLLKWHLWQCRPGLCTTAGPGSFQ